MYNDSSVYLGKISKVKNVFLFFMMIEKEEHLCIISNSKNFTVGGYDIEEKAARAYDMAALKYWGPSTRINFPVMINSLPFCLQFKDLIQY